MNSAPSDQKFCLLEGVELFGGSHVAASVQLMMNEKLPGITTGIAMIRNWTCERTLRFLDKECFIGDCGCHHEWASDVRKWTTIQCPFNAGAKAGTNLCCTHGLIYNFKEQATLCKLGAACFIAQRNNWYDIGSMQAHMGVLRTNGTTLIQIDAATRGKRPAGSELEAIKAQQREIGTKIKNDVVVPLAEVIRKHAA